MSYKAVIVKGIFIKGHIEMVFHDIQNILHDFRHLEQLGHLFIQFSIYDMQGDKTRFFNGKGSIHLLVD
ncbi:hypothetical protein D3C75_1201070 [compost metagenome]